MSIQLLQNCIIGCGIGHILLCLASLTIPKALRWKDHLRTLKPLLKQMFWTYAGYILTINFFFGVISVFASDEMLNHSFLAKSVTLFMALYWLARIGIQFFYFDRSDAPKGIIYVVGEIALIVLFAAFTITYFMAFIFNIWM